MKAATLIPSTLTLGIALFLTGARRPHADPMIVAHRGAPGYLPEHTIAGLALAHSWNPDLIEPDLVLTKDRHLIVMHDLTIEGVTDVAKKFKNRRRDDGHYYAIDFTLQELKALKVRERMDTFGRPVFAMRFPPRLGHFTIPTFKEWLETLQGLNRTRRTQVGLIPELKRPEFHAKEGFDIGEEFLSFYKTHKALFKGLATYLQCFHYETLETLRPKLPEEITFVQLIGNNEWRESSTNYEELIKPKNMKKVAGIAKILSPHFDHVAQLRNGKYESTGLIEAAHEAGLKVVIYTHRSDGLPEKIRSDDDFFNLVFKQLKVNGLFSDFADRAIRYRERL